MRSMTQDHTFLGNRGDTEIKGVTIKQIYEMVRNKLNYFDTYKSDPDAFCQDLCCRIEKRMGIYPNVEKLNDAASNQRHDTV